MSNIERDIRRFRKIGEDYRQDLTEFIKHGQLGEDIKVPIKIIDLPEFAYDKRDQGGIGQGDADVGDPVDAGEPDDGDGEPGEPGEQAGDHEYYEMDPSEFSELLDDELGLNFEDKGQKVVETSEGAFNETRRAGPDSTLDVDHLFKQAIKRHLSMYSDDEYLTELLKVRGYGVERVWNWARDNKINVSRSRVEELHAEIPRDQLTTYESQADIEQSLRRAPPRSQFTDVRFRRDDEQYRSPEVIEEPQQNAVVINIRDVSGSMREEKVNLVERVFTPLDWYLRGTYDNVEFVYIAHDAEAWEVNRDEFFGIRSGGGTQVSTAYEHMKQQVLSEYPWQSWNRFVFASGDGENQQGDTEDNLLPLIDEIDATRQAYVQVQPKRRRRGAYGRGSSTVGEKIEQEFGSQADVRSTVVEDRDDIFDALAVILDDVDDE